MEFMFPIIGIAIAVLIAVFQKQLQAGGDWFVAKVRTCWNWLSATAKVCGVWCFQKVSHLTFLFRHVDILAKVTKREIEGPSATPMPARLFPTVDYGFDPNFMARVMGTTPEVGVCSHTPGEVTVAAYHGVNDYFPNFTKVAPSPRVTAAYQGAGFKCPPQQKDVEVWGSVPSVAAASHSRS